MSESNSYQIISAPGDTSGTGIIPCTVDAYGYSSTHIIARKRTNSECSEQNMANLFNEKERVAGVTNLAFCKLIRIEETILPWSQSSVIKCGVGK